MKKINIPSQNSNVSSSSSLSEISLNQNSSTDIPLNQNQKTIFQKKDLPQISLNTNNLDGLNDKLKNIKLNNSQSDFESEIQQILSLYSDDELKFSYKLVLFVMTEVEKFILEPKSGDAKKNLVISVCQKYFNDDPELVNMVINLVFRDLPQVKFFKRQALKVVRFFSKTKSNQQ